MGNDFARWALVAGAAILHALPMDAFAGHRARGGDHGRHDRRAEGRDHSSRIHQDRGDSHRGRHGRSGRCDRYDHGQRNDRARRNNRSESQDRHGKRSRHRHQHGDAWQLVHFVTHLVDGFRHRQYDCGHRSRWEAGHRRTSRQHGRRYSEWIPGRWVTVRSCRR